MLSRIYTGLLTHTRIRPVRHSFSYPTYMLGLDLADLHNLHRAIPLFGYNQSRLCSIWDRDYLDPEEESIALKLTRLLDKDKAKAEAKAKAKAGCASGVATMYLLTMPRVLRMGFNPLNIFWCLDSSGHVGAVVAEVRNTYREALPYVLHAPHLVWSRAGQHAHYRFSKELFVSPFNGVEGVYDLRLSMPGEDLRIDIDLVCDEEPVVRARLRLRGTPLTTAALARTLCRYPLAAASSLPRIAYQAAVLRFVKKMKPRLKPKPASSMTISLSGPESKRSGEQMVVSWGFQREVEGMKAVQNQPAQIEARVQAAPRIEGRIAKTTVVVPAIGAAVAAAAAISGVARPTLLELIMTAALCLVTQLGVTVGFHRLFTHRSFEASRAIRLALGIAGSMTAQGALLFWVSEHREHHQKSDSAGDPHSPYLDGETALTGLRGFWHAHMGWMLDHSSTAWQTYARDIFADRLSLRVSRLYHLWVTAGVLLPGLIAGAWYRSWKHVALGVLWGGLVRIFLVHHATWSVNSIGHMIGRRAFATPDQSRNNGFVALITCGEGWHNNHHAFPSSARHGLERWQWDVSYALIRLLAGIGLAGNLKLPSPSQIARSKRSQRLDVVS